MFVSLPSSDGIVEVNELLARLIIVRAVALPREGGNDPANLLWATEKDPKTDKRLMSFGKLPVN